MGFHNLHSESHIGRIKRIMSNEKLSSCSIIIGCVVLFYDPSQEKWSLLWGIYYWVFLFAIVFCDLACFFVVFFSVEFFYFGCVLWFVVVFPSFCCCVFLFAIVICASGPPQSAPLNTDNKKTFLDIATCLMSH